MVFFRSSIRRPHKCDNNAHKNCRSSIPIAISISIAFFLQTTGCSSSAEKPTTTQPSQKAQISKPAAPLPPPGELNRCLALIRQGQTAAARDRLLPILQDHPDWPRANFMLALTYHTEKRYAEAKPLFAKVLSLDPNDHPVRMFYGWCLYYLGEAAEAGKMFDSYLVNANPNYPDAFYGLGLIEFDRDNVDLARQRFEKAVELASAAKDRDTEGKSRARLADLFIRTNELEKAKTQLELSVQLKPDAYAAYHKLSRVLERLGDHEGAGHARAKFVQVRAEYRRTHPDSARPEME